MWHLLTPAAKKAFFAAQKESENQAAAEVTCNHILLALLSEPKTGIGPLLETLGHSASQLESEIRSSLPEPKSNLPKGKSKLSEAAKNALDRAHREALSLEHPAIGVEHLLLGLVIEGNSATALDPDAIRRQVAKASTLARRPGLLNQMLDRLTSKPLPRAPKAEDTRPEQTKTLNEIRTAAMNHAQETGQAAAGTAEFLLQILLRPESAGARAVAATKIDPEDLKSNLNDRPTPAPRSVDWTLLTPAMTRSIYLARELAANMGSRPAGTGHLLLAMSVEPDSEAKELLTGAGLTYETLWMYVRNLEED